MVNEINIIYEICLTQRTHRKSIDKLQHLPSIIYQPKQTKK